MGFGPARPPMMEDVEEVIARDIKSAEGHGETSEVPLPFLRNLYRVPLVSGKLQHMRRAVVGLGLLAILFGLIWAWTAG
ncbi:hypothetical protein [Sinorhizobium mexicanum]|uniref:Uncharacterized protein n=1 Tax=Sinorhizobium mexicanum TaxID=375549 RepID=A0A859QEQ7_9HYPH|nr:hypothetical protein [Sinorhizobium mexicanum]MBP1887205.1 hypothetical protein [Sinorhizobium mexicanum]QLL60205.1 hypothetical protein FKV68_01480 [Sinorhizobium mexicanum]